MVDIGGIKCNCGEDATVLWTTQEGDIIDILCDDCFYARLEAEEKAQEGPDDDEW